MLLLGFKAGLGTMVLVLGVLLVELSLVQDWGVLVLLPFPPLIQKNRSMCVCVPEDISNPCVCFHHSQFRRRGGLLPGCRGEERRCVAMENKRTVEESIAVSLWKPRIL